MRLWLLYASDSGYPADVHHPWDNHRQTSNWYATEFFPTEGFSTLCRCLLDEKIVDRVTVVVDAAHNNGRYIYGENFDCLVPPSLADIYPLIKPGDIILGRCGFRQWYFTLEQIYLRRQNWMLFYRANSNRQKWPVWDVELEDLITLQRPTSENFDRNLRLHLPFAKPINSAYFHPMPLVKAYDLCIGASHIHDKKGQWRALQLLRQLKHSCGRSYKCIMPGAFRRSPHNAELIEWATEMGIEMPDHVHRDELRRIYNKSRVLMHFGSVGQNDRCLLEATACGVPCVLGREYTPDITPPYLQAPPNHVVQPEDYDSALWLDDMIHRSLAESGNVLQLAQPHINPYVWTVPSLRVLFGYLTAIGMPDRVKLKEAYATFD